MPITNVANMEFINTGDGWSLKSGASSARKLTLTSGDVTIAGGGTVTYSFPTPASGTSETLVGRTSTDTLTNKTITDSTNTVSAKQLFAVALASAISTNGQVYIYQSSSTSFIPKNGLRQFSGVFHTALTPTAGLDNAVIQIPYDGTTSVSYTLKRIWVRAETSSGSASTFRFERMQQSSTGTWSATTTIYATGTTDYTFTSANEYSSTSFTSTTVSSGDKLRIRWSAVGSGLANVTVTLFMEESI
jgi:hypothetical protein